MRASGVSSRFSSIFANHWIRTLVLLASMIYQFPRTTVEGSLLESLRWAVAERRFLILPREVIGEDAASRFHALYM